MYLRNSNLYVHRVVSARCGSDKYLDVKGQLYLETWNVFIDGRKRLAINEDQNYLPVSTLLKASASIGQRKNVN
jgi:hypothetical protein